MQLPINPQKNTGTETVVGYVCVSVHEYIKMYVKFIFVDVVMDELL